MLRFILFLILSYSAVADTLVRTGCSKDYPGVQWFIYEDADGNRYSTKDPRSRKCGYRRYLNLSMEKDAGDRFDPAIVNVDETPVTVFLQPADLDAVDVSEFSKTAGNIN